MSYSFWAIFIVFGQVGVLARWQLDRYHSHRHMEEFLLGRAKNNKDITVLYSIGKSVQGRELWVMELSAANRSQLGVPNVKLIGNMHGNEPVGRELIIYMIQHLIDRYRDGDEEVVRLLSTTRVHLLPTMNPDGYKVAVEGLCTGGPGRGNSRRQDLNRNFPGRGGTRETPEQPETSAIRRWMSSVQFVLSASLHSGSLVVSYPYDSRPEHHLESLYDRLSGAQSEEEFDEIWKENANAGWGIGKDSATPDDDVFKHLARLYSSNNPSMTLGCGQDTMFKDGIVNGAHWYPITGSMQDYNYMYHGCLEVTLQISCCKYPYAGELQGIWRENYSALIKLMGEAQRGVRGVVRDRTSGRTLPGSIVSLEGTNRTACRTSLNGEYWKILLPGNYMIKVEADGYHTKSVCFTMPEWRTHKAPLLLDVELERATNPLVATPTETIWRPPIGWSQVSTRRPQEPTNTNGISSSRCRHSTEGLLCIVFILYQLMS